MTADQRHEIERWNDSGWAVLYWTQVPEMIAVLENQKGDIVFIDRDGWVWEGPTFDKTKPAPLQKYPPVNEL